MGSDYKRLKKNLEELEDMSPLTEREIRIAQMQFGYTATKRLLDDVDDDPRFFGGKARQAASKVRQGS